MITITVQDDQVRAELKSVGVRNEPQRSAAGLLGFAPDTGGEFANPWNPSVS